MKKHPIPLRLRHLTVDDGEEPDLDAEPDDDDYDDGPYHYQPPGDEDYR